MRRYLIVGNQSLGSNDLYDVVRESMSRGPCSFHVVVPATPPTEHLTWTEEEARAIARDRLERALTWIGELEPTVDGEVGDRDPMLAIWDSLRERDYDEIILSTLPAGLSRWLRMDLASRVKARFPLPVTLVVMGASQRAAQ